MRTRWTKELVRQRILEISDGKRIPTVSEMRRSGFPWGNALACKVSRTNGGLDGWARELGLELRDHDSRKGQLWEQWVAEGLRQQGHQVKWMTGDSVKAPYDLDVDGLRVDVKCSERGEYGACRGWFFNMRRKADDCDFYVFVCLLDEAPERTYVIPEAVVPKTMLTITDCGKYEKYRDQWSLLERKQIP